MKKATIVAPVPKPYADVVNIDKLPKLKTSLLVQRVHDMVLAFEAWQTKTLGRKHVAVRTRKALVAKGVVKTVSDACLTRPSPGFRLMVENKKPFLTYEWIALEFSRSFDKKVLEAARARLDLFGVKGYQGWVKPEKPDRKAKPVPAPEPEKKGRGWNLKGRKKAVLATADAAG